MTIYNEINHVMDHMFNACTTAQISEFIPEKRGFRIHGHSTTVSLERAFWNVLEAMASECHLAMPRLLENVLDNCLVANDKNLSSCLRVICLKYMNIYATADTSPEAALNASIKSISDNQAIPR
ncbi:ribbon-helix-helix domain-containing protein [Sulfuricella sp.]|uniref:ribbon-helix-helix domain-containing protein n=1 Tax=Sulfuricella sp. TaxID=2099377 RepID=UPI002BB764C2|nr:ribbon-helix-helix domain-containing protein [Sulfuricella sp.]HUX62266.1 ribbon-helix-helix domain-containing protein [Sulfuricella sp.]